MDRTLWAIDRKGTLSLNLHAGQTRAWANQKRFVAVLAGKQSGKTSFRSLVALERNPALRGRGLPCGYGIVRSLQAQDAAGAPRDV